MDGTKPKADTGEDYGSDGRNSALAVGALEKMNTHEITQLAVIDDNNYYLGIIHLHDLIREGII